MAASLYTASLFVVAIYSSVVAIVSWRRAKQRGARIFAWLMCSVALWCLGHALEILTPDLAGKTLWAKLQFLGIAPLPALWLLFALDYIRGPQKIKLGWQVALWSVPVSTALLALTNEWHRLIWSNSLQASPAAINELSFAPGVWFWIFAVYTYGLVVAGMVLFVRASVRSRGMNRAQAATLAAGGAFPVAASLLFMAGLTTHNLTPVAFGIMGLIYGWNILHFQFMDLVPTARSLLIDDLGDAVVVIDMQGQIVDANQAGLRLLGGDGPQGLIGQDLNDVAPAWAGILARLDGARRQIEVNQPDADYDVSVAPIQDRSGQTTGTLLVIHNISVRKATERRLLESEARFRTLVETAPEAMLLTSSQGSILQANRRVGDLFGYEPDALAGVAIRKLIPDYSSSPQRGHDQGTQRELTQPSGAGHEMIGLHRDGSEIPLAVSYSPVITAGGVVYTNIVHDLSTLRKTEEQLRLQAQALNAAANGMVLSTAEGIILWVNAAFTEMTGYLAGEALGKSTRLLRSGIHDHNFYREMWTTILAGQVWRGELTNRRKDGSLYVEYQTISPVLGPGGRITHFIAVKQDVTERKRAEEQLRQQARELAIINEIGQAAASNLDLSTLIQLVGQKIHQIFGAWMVYIALLNEQTGFTEFPFYMIEGKQVPDPGTLAPGEGLTAVVMRERVPLLIDKDFADRADQLGAVPTSTFAVQRPKTWIGIPIVGGERVIGVLSVQDADREQAYSQDELRLLTTVAANLGVAIENARLYQTEQERRAEAETLQEVTAALTASLQRDEVLAIILQQLKRVVSYDSASVMQWDDEESLRVVAHAGFRSQSQSDFRPTRETAPNIWRVVTEKRYCLVPDTWEDPSWNRDATEEDYIRCWMGTPLIFKGEAIGLLNIDNERPNAYSERDLRIASVFADQAAIAIENARLYEQAQSEIGHRRQTELSLREANRSLVQQVREIAALQEQLREQALRDPVTGLYNRRYLDESLPREIGRAEREHGQVGAIMMDLDHFKAINDAYGHINGDKALVSLGELLNTRSRTSDIACRFGGEEFCLILPGATLRAVLDRAEELRAAFEGTTISTDQGSFHVTISLGAAIFPLHANSAESLVARADEALYRAKRAGRNCVILAGSHGSSAQEAQLPS